MLTICPSTTDGSKNEAIMGVTTPMDIAASISKGLAKKAVVAKVK